MINNICVLMLFFQVVPIVHFVSHCEATWMKMLWERETDSDLMNNSDKNSHLSCEGLSYSGSIRRIMVSEDIGVVLLGSVKFSDLILIDFQFC